MSAYAHPEVLVSTEWLADHLSEIDRDQLLLKIGGQLRQDFPRMGHVLKEGGMLRLFQIEIIGGSKNGIAHGFVVEGVELTCEPVPRREKN